MRPVVFSLVRGQVLAWLALDGGGAVQSRYDLAHRDARRIPVVAQAVAVKPPSVLCVPARKAVGKRRMLHLVHLEVVPAAWGMCRLVDHQPVEAGRVLDLDRMGLGLGRVVRFLHVGPHGLLYGLLGGVGQGDQPREQPVELLDGCSLSGLPVELLRDGETLPYDRDHLPDVGRDGSLANPEQVGHAVLGQVGPVVHEDQKNPVPRVQGERAARARPAHPARVLEPLSLGLRIGLFDVSHQKIELLERHADCGSERAGVL